MALLVKSRCFSADLPLALLAKGGRGLFLMPPLSGPLPLACAKGFADGPIVLPMPPKEPNGSLMDGWVCTRPCVEENTLLLEPSRYGVAVPGCHHDADVDWSSAGWASVEDEEQIVLIYCFERNCCYVPESTHLLAGILFSSSLYVMANIF